MPLDELFNRGVGMSEEEKLHLEEDAEREERVVEGRPNHFKVKLAFIDGNLKHFPLDHHLHSLWPFLFLLPF